MFVCKQKKKQAIASNTLAPPLSIAYHNKKYINLILNQIVHNLLVWIDEPSIQMDAPPHYGLAETATFSHDHYETRCSNKILAGHRDLMRNYDVLAWQVKVWAGQEAP